MSCPGAPPNNAGTDANVPCLGNFDQPACNKSTSNGKVERILRTYTLVEGADTGTWQRHEKARDAARNNDSAPR